MNPLHGNATVNLDSVRDSQMMPRNKMNEADSHHATGKMETMDQGKEEAMQRSAGHAIIQIEETLISILGYLVENRIASNPVFPFVLILSAFLISFVVFSALWYEVGSHDSNDDDLYGTNSASDALFLTLQMLTTGQYTDGIPQKNGYRLLYFLMIFVGPFLIFAILIGFLNEGVSSFMLRLKEGKTNVHEKNHTLILGWNEATARVVVQAAFLRRQYQTLNEGKFWILTVFPLLRIPLSWMGLLERPSTSIANNNIVVMCNQKTKEEMHVIIQNTCDERGIKASRTKIGQNIVCRVGDPTDVNDLLRVGADRASAILVQMTQTDEEEEERTEGRIQNGATTRVALAVRDTLLSHRKDSSSDVRVVLQMSKPSEFIDAACFVNKEGHEVMLAMDLSIFLNSLLFKSAAQPGLAKVLLQIFDFEKTAIRRRKAKNLRGGPYNEMGHCCGLGSAKGKRQTFEELQKQYDIANFIGIVRPSITDKEEIKSLGLGLCPNPKIHIEKEDLLIFIGPRSNPRQSKGMENITNQYKAQAETLFPAVAENRTPPPKYTKGTLICGWRKVWNKNPNRLYDRIIQIAKVCLPSSTITFLNLVEPDEFEDIMRSMDIPRYGGADPQPLPENYPAYRLYMLRESTNFGGVILRHLVGDSADPQVLRPIIFSSTIHSTIVLGTQSGVSLDPKSRDTRVMCIMLLLRKLCKEKLKMENVPMHVVGENEEDMTARLAIGPIQKGDDPSDYRMPDFINTQAIYARVLTQALAYPLIVPAIRDLIAETPGSPDITFVMAKNYVPLGVDITMGVVKQMVLLAEGERSIFLGFQYEDGTIELSKEHYETHCFTNKEFLVVFKKVLMHT